MKACIFRVRGLLIARIRWAKWWRKLRARKPFFLGIRVFLSNILNKLWMIFDLVLY
jgi:hypothetical protein